MNSNTNKQAREHAGDSSMTSDHDHRRPGATAMRAGTQHRENEFMIAQSEHGGAAPDHSKGPNKEPVNHFGARVLVGLNKPLTIFPIGGGSSDSTLVGSVGESHGPSKSSKECIYHEEVQPLGHGPHRTNSSNSGNGTNGYSAASYGVHRNPISSTLGLRSDNHLQTSFGPTHFLSSQRAHSHVPSSLPSTGEGHARAVPAHRDEKIKHHDPHVVNEPTDHHNHYRHQCDTDVCMDHNESHQHLTPSSSSRGSHGRGHEVSHSQHAVLHAHGHSSPMLYLASSKEPTSWGYRKHQAYSSQGYRPHTFARSAHNYDSEGSTLNLAPVFREPVSWGPKTHQDSEADHHNPHRHHQIAGHAHSVPAHRDGKLTRHIYGAVNEPTDHHDHFRHQCDTTYCKNHNASHRHTLPSSVTSYHTHARTKVPELLRSSFKGPITWGRKRISFSTAEATSRRQPQSHRQIPGHAHAVPAHRDGKIKHHLPLFSNTTDFHNYFRHQCDSEYCMEQNDSHAHHRQPPVPLKDLHVRAPLRHWHGISRSHHAYVPLTPINLNIPALALVSDRSHSKLYKQQRHPTGHELPVSHPTPLVHKHLDWVLVTRKRRASEVSHSQDHHPYRHAPRLEHLEALFGSESIAGAPTKHKTQAKESSRGASHSHQQILGHAHSAPSRNYGAQHVETPEYVHEHDGSSEQNHPDGLWTLSSDKNHKHDHQMRSYRVPGKSEMQLDALKVDAIHKEHGSHRRSRQIPGHAHAVPAHRDNGLKRHQSHVPNAPTDHRNHYRHKCDPDHCMDHNEIHAHHGQPSVENHSRQVTAPVRHRLEIRRAHHAYMPLTPAGLMVPDEVPPLKASRKKRHVSVPSRNYGAQHIETPEYVHENDSPQEQVKSDCQWTIVMDKNRRRTGQIGAHRVYTATEMHPDTFVDEYDHGLRPVPESHSQEDQYVPGQERDWTRVTYTRPQHKEPAPAHYHNAQTRGVKDTPEMNLEAIFEGTAGNIPSKPSGHPDQRRPKSLHNSTPWAPSAYDYTHHHSEEHHPPSIHSFSAPRGDHTHAVPAHREGKLGHQYHEKNDPADHHNHRRHQRNDEDGSDRNESHIHAHGGNSNEDQQNHPGFVHYSTPHNRTIGSYDAKYATRSARHTAQTHNRQMATPDSPELNLGALFLEETSHGHSKGKTIKNKQSEGQAPPAVFISEQHAHRIGHHHEPRLSQSIQATQATPHGESHAKVAAASSHGISEHIHSDIHAAQLSGTQRRRADSFHGYVFQIPQALGKVNKQHSRYSSQPRRRSAILSGFREVDPVSRYYPVGMYLAPTSVQHGLASAYLRRPSSTQQPRHYNTADRQHQPYTSIHHTGSVAGEYATHIGDGVKNRFSGPAETTHDLFAGLDTPPSHHQPLQGHVSRHTPVYHSGVPQVAAQSASVQHSPSNVGSQPKKMRKTWYGVEVPIKEGGHPGPRSLGFGFNEIRKAAMEGAQHASGPSTPVSSAGVPVNKSQASESSTQIKTYSDAVAHPHGPANLTRRPSIKRQRKDFRRELKSTLDRTPHQTLRRRLSVLETVRTALSGVRMDLVEDMKLDELFVEPACWSDSHEASVPSSKAEAVVLAGLGGIRHLFDAALNVPAMVAHALHVDDQQQETEQRTVVHHGQRHHHSYGHSKAVTLKTSRLSSLDLSLYPEEEPDYPRDDDPHPSMHENPAYPKRVADCVIEMPYHPHRLGSTIVSHVSGNMRRSQGHHLAHRPHYHMQKRSTNPTHLHTQVGRATSSHEPVHHSQAGRDRTRRGRHNLSASLFRAGSPVVHNDLHPEENAGSPRTDAFSLHGNNAHPDSVMAAAEHPLESTPMLSLSGSGHHGLYPEENAGYPRTDAFSLHRNPPHPNLNDIVELPYSSSSSSSSTRLSTLNHARMVHSYNRSKAANLYRPVSPLYLYSEEQASYPRDASRDVACKEYDPRADEAVHQSRVYAPNPYIRRRPVHEIQLDDKDQHAHHDAHPTLTESAAAAVSSGLGGFKAMLQSMHLPGMVVGTLLPEAHEYLQEVQHHAQEHRQEHKDLRPVLKYKDDESERRHLELEGDSGSSAHHTSHSAHFGSFVPSEHHSRHVEHVSMSPLPRVHTSSFSSQSAAAAALAAKHALPVSVLPPELSSPTARLSRPPTGFGRSADDDLGEDETIVWTKTVKTTKDYYEVDDDNVDMEDMFSFQVIQRHHDEDQLRMRRQIQGQQQRSRSPQHAQ